MSDKGGDYVDAEKAVSDSPDALPRLGTVVSEPTGMTVTEVQPAPVASDGATAGNSQNEKSATIDGGWTAWLVVLGAWCASFCSYGWINSMCLMFPLRYSCTMVGANMMQVLVYSNSTMRMAH